MTCTSGAGLEDEAGKSYKWRGRQAQYLLRRQEEQLEKLDLNVKTDEDDCQQSRDGGQWDRETD